jgi:hypothetical protein
MAIRLDGGDLEHCPCIDPVHWWCTAHELNKNPKQLKKYYVLAVLLVFVPFINELLVAVARCNFVLSVFPPCAVDDRDVCISYSSNESLAAHCRLAVVSYSGCDLWHHLTGLILAHFKWKSAW